MSDFVYVNLNSYPVYINTPNGVPISLRPNQGVSGDFFSRYAKPAGALTLTHRSEVKATSIIVSVEPKDDAQAAAWDEVTTRVLGPVRTEYVNTPATLNTVENLVTKTDEVTVSEEGAAVVTSETDLTKTETTPKKRGGRKAKDTTAATE